jgi:hypothetical protein
MACRPHGMLGRRRRSTTTVACPGCGQPNPLKKRFCGDGERAGRRGRVTLDPYWVATPHHRLGYSVTHEIVVAGPLLNGFYAPHCCALCTALHRSAPFGSSRGRRHPHAGRRHTQLYSRALHSADMLPSRHATTGTSIVRTAFADTVVGDEKLARISVECLERHPGRREEVLANGCKAPRREWERAA